jgi:hypothetical protein
LQRSPGDSSGVGDPAANLVWPRSPEADEDILIVHTLRW